MANATFRKNAKTGNWDVFGPASFVLAGSFCSVSRADGTVRRIYVETVSRSFQVNGTPYVYGVIGKAPAKAAPTPAPEPVHFGAPVTAEYDDCARDADDSFNVF